MVDTAIRFVLEHNLSIIQWLVFAIVATAILLAAMVLFGQPDKANLNQTPSAEKALLEKMNEVLAAGIAKTGVNASPEELRSAAARVAELEAQIKIKAQEVEELKSAVATGHNSAQNLTDYQKQIADLQARLAEYEIIEDDIADLSLFKEENARLKSELLKLQGSLPEPAATSVAVAQGPSENLNEDLVTEFQAAVQESKKIEEQPPTPAAPVAPAAAPAPNPAPAAAAAAAAAPSALPDEGDDLLSEFVAELTSGEAPAAEETGVIDGVDPEKMLQEVSQMQETTTDLGVDENTDVEKIAKEASGLGAGQS